MNDLRKAAEMALDALLDIPMDQRTGPQVETIQTLRQALAQTEQKREWVGLTDEDLSVCDDDGILLAMYWEAKLKEKNGA